jgi:hypothetical protein
MLAEVAASRMSTAELEMKAAPAAAAATGGIVLTGIGGVLPKLRPECHDQNKVMVMTLACALVRSQHGFCS